MWTSELLQNFHGTNQQCILICLPNKQTPFHKLIFVFSDLVFIRTWYRVDIPKFYNPATTLLLPKDSKDNWSGMRTVGQMRREMGIAAPQSADSSYKVSKVVYQDCKLGLWWPLNKWEGRWAYPLHHLNQLTQSYKESNLAYEDCKLGL